MDLNVKNIRYFKTRRGLGYEVKTDKGTIWNDGNGGATYFEADYKKKEREFNDLSKAYEFAEGLWLWEGYDYIKLYDNTRESRKVIAEDWGER